MRGAGDERAGSCYFEGLVLSAFARIRATVTQLMRMSPVERRKAVLELIRFGSVGGSTAAMYFGLVWLVAKLFPSFDWWVIVTITSAPPLVTAYVLHRSFTFKSQTQHKTSGPRFLAVQLIANVLNSLAIWLGVDLAHLPFIPVQLAAIALQVLFTYTTQKLFVFA